MRMTLKLFKFFLNILKKVPFFKNFSKPIPIIPRPTTPSPAEYTKREPAVVSEYVELVPQLVTTIDAVAAPVSLPISLEVAETLKVSVVPVPAVPKPKTVKKASRSKAVHKKTKILKAKK